MVAAMARVQARRIFPPATKRASQRTTEALRHGVESVETPDEATRVLDALERNAGDVSMAAVSDRIEPPGSPDEQADAIENASASPESTRAAAVILTTAVQSATGAPDSNEAVDEAVSKVLGGQDAGNENGTTGVNGATKSEKSAAPLRGQRLLREALLRRLRPFRAWDVVAFAMINQIPHTPLSDRLMGRLSWAMTGGHGWLAVLLAGILTDRKGGWRAAGAVLPALWLTTATVEHPVKNWFRRRRPFLAIVQAIVVGRKPGSYSFPSGHAASAYAGAVLLARQYPKGAPGFYTLATFVAFSRIYLGAHYPSDVITGSLVGAALARIYASLFRRVGIPPRQKDKPI